jgi:prepilin-type N-terminal cleavage/methylation domain-containing protein
MAGFSELFLIEGVTPSSKARMRPSKKGFTLIELLVVILVVGILSAIAISRFVAIRESAYLATMKADLRNFAIYEQNSMADNPGSYFAGNGAAQGFTPTPGVTVTATVDPGPPQNWRAIATHTKTVRTCAITPGVGAIWDIDCP